MPFILKAGKALNERKAEIRIQLRPTAHFIFGGDPDASRNEASRGDVCVFVCVGARDGAPRHHSR